MVSWIHLEDTARAIDFIEARSDLSGPINVTAPHPVTNAEFQRTLRQVIAMPIGLPTPRWLLELGGLVVGAEAELVLKSRWVLPKVLSDAGFEFRYPQLRAALESILRRTGY